MTTIEFRFGLLAMGVIYLLGLFVPLMENDAAQFAVMAMRIAESNDYLHLFKGSMPYLDKPHLHYWLAALSFEAFGIHAWAYRLPGLACIGMAAWSTYGITRLFYSKITAEVSTLFFLSSQAVVLMGHDMRTDAVLTGFTALALWQLLNFFEKGSWESLMIGALALGASFSTKGLLGLVVCGMCLIGYWILSKKIHKLWNLRTWLVGLFCFALATAPIFYAYHTQFGMDGIYFIIWGQSFERMSGGTWESQSPEYSFFWHTLLWACLPYGLMVYLFWYDGLKQLLDRAKQAISSAYGVTVIGLLAIMVLISFSEFKLPHYLNVLMPYFAIAAATYVVDVWTRERKAWLWITYLQMGIFTVGLLLASVICLWFFRNGGVVWFGVTLVSAAVILWYVYQRRQEWLKVVVLLSVGAIFVSNLSLNGHFYYRLGDYQAGSRIADWVKEEGIDRSNIFKLDPLLWSYDFGLKEWSAAIGYDELAEKARHDGSFYAICNTMNLKYVDEQQVDYEVVSSFDDFRITRLKYSFLNPATRRSVLEHLVVIRIDEGT